VSIFSRFFSRSPSDFLAKGDSFMESDRFFDARTAYEDGLALCQGKVEYNEMKIVFISRIEDANRKLAELNIHEAEFASSRGDVAKAIDHLELVKTLTYDPELREKAEKLLLDFVVLEDESVVPVVAASCASCSGSSRRGYSDDQHSEASLSLLEYYELLIQQLPSDQYERYTQLGEDFAYAFSAASRDEHQEALAGFENCAKILPPDIYHYEKAKVLHRLGDDNAAEQHFRTSIEQNRGNSLAWLSLALLLQEQNRLKDAAIAFETMIAEDMMPGQSLLMRAGIYEATGDHESAINQYVKLLQTPYATVAAEKLYVLLLDTGRKGDADIIMKKYLKKSCH